MAQVRLDVLVISSARRTLRAMRLSSALIFTLSIHASCGQDVFMAAAPKLDAQTAVRPPFSWDKLPVFFHSQNSSGPWNAKAVAAIRRYPMATFEKAHAAAGKVGTSEVNGPAACKQVHDA